MVSSLQQIDRSRAGDLEPSQRRHVEHGHGGAGLPRLDGGDGGVEHAGPRVTRRPAATRRAARRAARRWPRTSTAAPSRRPPGRRRPARCCRAWNGLTRRLAGRLLGLQRVQDVVDLHEVLLGGLADVAAGELDVLEAVTRRTRRGRSADRPVVSSSATARATPAEWVTQTASATKKPSRSGRLADQRAAVGGEGEDAVEAVLDLALAQRRQQLLAMPPTPGAKSSGVKSSRDGMCARRPAVGRQSRARSADPPAWVGGA